MIERVDEWRAHHPKNIVNNDKINHKETAVITLTILTYLTFDKNAKNRDKLSVWRQFRLRSHSAPVTVTSAAGR